jgi:hypothetical protein
MYVVAVVKDIYPEGYRTLENEDVKSHAEMMAKRDKKAELLEKMLRKSLSETGSLAKTAEKYNTEMEPATVIFGDRNFYRFGPESKVIGQIFAQKDAKLDVYKGETGVYAVKIIKFDLPKLDVEDAGNNMYLQQSAMMYQRHVSNGAKTLKKLYKIEDNRYKTF